MRKLAITRDALKFFEGLDAKQYRQVGKKLFSLLVDPEPNDASPLKGNDFWRVDVGEYRIVYKFDGDTVSIAIIGKRNDEVYKKLERR